MQAGVMLASTDRIAIDAVGIAILRMLGTTRNVSNGWIWSPENLRLAADLGLGAARPEQVEIVTADSDSPQMTEKIRFF